MKHTILEIFRNFFRYNLRNAIIFSIVTMITFSGVLTLLAQKETENSAKNFIHNNRSYFLGLILSKNFDAIAIFLKNEKIPYVSYVYYADKLQCNVHKKINLTLGGEFFGCVAYKINYFAIVPWSTLLFLLIFIILLTLFFWKLSQRTSMFIHEHVILPLRYLSDSIQNSKDLKDLAKISVNERGALEIALIQNTLIASGSRLLETEVAMIKNQLAHQLAHDIRSPIAAMTIVVSDIAVQISEEQASLLQQAIQQIRGIANNLLIRYKNPDQEKMIETSRLKIKIDDTNRERYVLLSSLVNTAIFQKRFEWQNNPCDVLLEITPEAKTIWILVAPIEINRLLSNLLNNAYEALEKRRHIKIHVSKKDHQLILSIQDTGKGIPEDKIIAVINGMSLKDSGNGLGLSSAKKTMKSLGGELQLTSEIYQGTTVTLFFLICKQPTWFPTQMVLSLQQPILVLDNDPSIHSFWQKQLYPHRSMHFVKSAHLFAWLTEHPEAQKKALFLVDYELSGDSRNGLEILEQFQPAQRGYLITSHAEEVDIQLQCATLGIWLIPKAILSDIKHSESSL